MDKKTTFSKNKLTEQSVTPEQLSPSFIAHAGTASQCSINNELLNQEIEYLWEDCNAAGKSYEVYLGKISRNPVLKSKITGKYFALPWPVIIRLAVENGIDK